MSGTAPNRIFNIEWPPFTSLSPTEMANLEMRLYEGQKRFDVIYGKEARGNTRATAGVQRNDTCFAQKFSNGYRWIRLMVDGQ